MIDLIIRFIVVFLLVKIGFAVYQKPSDWPKFIKFLPLTGFMVYARMKGMTSLAWQEAFYVAGLLALIVFAVLWYKKITLDRLMLGMNLFLFSAAVGFFFNIEPLLNFYEAYKGVALLGNVAIVGILSTLFFPAGFIGIVHSDTMKSSLILLGASILAVIWSVIMNTQGIALSAALPFILLKIFQEYLITQTR